MLEDSTKKTVLFEISWLSIIKVVAIILGVYLLFYLADIFLILFVVFILASALSPLVDTMKSKLKIPRIMSILLIYIGLLLIVALTIYAIIPPAIEQLQNLSQNLPDYAKKITSLFSSLSESPVSTTNSIQSASSTLGNVAGTFVQSAGTFFGGLTTVFYILILTLFLLLEEDGIRKFFISLLPISQKSYVIEVSKKVADKMGAWLIGQVSLMGIIGFVTALGLWIIGVPYALTLGIIAFFLEAVPTVGPIIAAIPAVIIAYMDAPWKAVVVLIFATLIQQLENQFLVPKIMQKALGISPFVTLVALLVGGKLAGVMGVLLAVPTVAALSVLSKEWPNIRKRI
ncbi:MAG: AI-2E family transporter [Patescibacteria group bacterium]|nr:AI-2E family transporter [Patescibacteria group bacterium]